MDLTTSKDKAVTRFLSALVNPRAARVLVAPYENAPGFWFGGGNAVIGDDGDVWLSGRYRNYGDSRTGTKAGLRGLELALFKASSPDATFEKVASWSKRDLSGCGNVLSIEGSSLRRRDDGSWELFLSVEIDRPYPQGYEAFQKPGTGVWSILSMTGERLDTLDVNALAPVLGTEDPRYLHVKDPVSFTDTAGNEALIFCSHPVSWASSNTGLARRTAPQDAFEVPTWELVPRGPIWDVAVTRVTGRLQLPAVGHFAGRACSVYFYDGAECMRPLDENPAAKARPRGYSCEELGGAFISDDADPKLTRLSVDAPLFVSRQGTGSCRYIETLTTQDGIFALWQQSNEAGAQPLVGNFLSNEQIAHLLE